jgi:hypothetical protein
MIVAERDPLLVIVLQGKDSGVRAIRVRQELAQNIDTQRA